jgi:hypothetical protein
MDQPAAVEQDSTDTEDIPNILEFIVPPKSVLDSALKVNIHYNRGIFAGWVKQPSACCGASSVAGAWNTLHGFHRSNPLAMNHEHVLEVYRSIMLDRINEKTKSFERKLGAVLSIEFWSQFEYDFNSMGREFAGRKGKGISKKSVHASLTNVLGQYLIRQRTVTSLKPTDNDNSKISYEDSKINQPVDFTCFDGFLEMYKLDGITIDLQEEPLQSEEKREIDASEVR